MKYTTDEAFEEITRRGKLIRQQKERKQMKVLSAVSCMLAFALIGAFGVLNGSGNLRSGSAYGSFLVSAESGGYILIAVLAFALGVFVTVTIQKYRKSKERTDW